MRKTESNQMETIHVREFKNEFIDDSIRDEIQVSNHRENIKKEAMYFTAKTHTENRRQTLKIKIEKRKD